jgi:hypothetical protein
MNVVNDSLKISSIKISIQVALRARNHSSKIFNFTFRTLFAFLDSRMELKDEAWGEGGDIRLFSLTNSNGMKVLYLFELEFHFSGSNFQLWLHNSYLSSS